MTFSIFDKRPCQLGEGPLWHPLRRQLFWFDITGRTLMSVDETGAKHWSFDETVSAAGWVDENTLLVASARGLWRFDIESGSRTLVCALETENNGTRSNDGRADPWGGFWIGTMGYNAEPGAGAIYRFYQGALKKLFDQITVSNTICFAQDRSCMFFADTLEQKVMKATLDDAGWPRTTPEVFIDLRPKNLNPDGAVVDASGRLWVALWGASRIAAFGADGSEQQSIPLPAKHVTCPAFGGKDLATLYVTSARQGLDQSELTAHPENGMTFEMAGQARGVPEPQVIL